jgi:hypothetical protein
VVAEALPVCQLDPRQVAPPATCTVRATASAVAPSVSISGGDFTIFLERTNSLVLIIAIVVLVLLPALLPRIRRAVASWLAAVARRRAAREPEHTAGQ